MTPAPFLLKLKNRLAEDAWGWVAAALRQDALTWETLESNAVLADKALAAFSGEPERWSPAALSLLALNSPVSLESLKTSPLQPLPQPLCGQAISAYKAWQKEINGAMGLAEAGLVALSLRERRRVTGSWKGLAEELQGRRSVGAILACLYGWAPDAYEFLLALLGPGAPASQVELGLHGLLSNPITPSAQCELLQRLAANLSADVGMTALRLLGAGRPALAASLAEELLSLHGEALFTSGLAGSRRDGALLHELEEKLAAAETYRLAAAYAEESPVLTEAMKRARLIQAEIAGELGQSAANRGEVDTAVEMWKQASQLAPDSPRCLAGLALALLGAGRVAEASLLLEEGKSQSAFVSLAGQAEGRRATHPSVLVASAMAAARMGERERARQIARQAIEWAESQALEGWRYEGEAAGMLSRLSSLFLENGLPQESARCSGLALKSRPNDSGLLAQEAQALLALDRPEAALGPAAAALALGAGKRSYRQLLVSCLEAASEWQAALQERLALVEDHNPLDVNELHALANCALHAGQLEQAANACQQALALDSKDGLAYNLLGETTQALGDPLAAIEYFQQATQYVPHLPSAWLSLVQALRQVGQEEQAFETLRTASQAIPDSAEIQMVLAKAYLSDHALTQALACLRRAYALAPAQSGWARTNGTPVQNDAAAGLYPRIALRLGQTLRQLGHLDEARQVLEEAYQTGPTMMKVNKHTAEKDNQSSELAYAYAQTLLGLGEETLALDPLEQAARLLPEEPAPNLDYARTLLEVGKDDPRMKEAIPVLEHVLSATAEVSEEHQQALALLAEALTATGDLDRAGEAYRKALEMPLAKELSWRARLSLGMGKVALGLGQIETAMAALQEAVQADPSNVAAQRKLCEASLAVGLNEEALQSARAALRLNPYDPDTVTWFAEQAVQLRSRPGEMQSQAQAEAIAALERATQLTPSRTDLILHLGEMQMQTGDAAVALETLGRLTAAGEVALDDLYQGAKYLRQLGDPQQSVLLLERALTLLKNQGEAGAVDLSNLLRELIVAHRQAGNVEAVAEVLDRTLAIQPADTFLYLSKADLLLDLEKPEEALACLEKALSLTPDDAALHERIARLLQLTGELPAALEHAQEAIRVAEAAEGALNLPARCLAAYLARAMLQPVRARRFLETTRPEGHEADLTDRFNFACLKAEMALDANDGESTGKTLLAAAEIIARHPRLAAIQARHTARDGDLLVGAQVLKTALANMNSPQPDSNHPLARAALLRSVAEAAMELGEWVAGIDLMKQIAEASDMEPLAHYQLAEALVLRAEAQYRCRALDIIEHAPGEEALSSEAYTEFCAAILSARELAFRCAPEPEDEPGGSPSPAAGLQAGIAAWEARGQAAFKTTIESVQALEKVLRLGVPGPDDVAAYIAALSRLGQTGAAVKASQTYPHNIQMLMEAALALADAEPRQALGITNLALANATHSYGRISVELPGLHVLLARLAATVGGRASDHDIAMQAMQTALIEWPEEPRWHALAATICLGGSHPAQHTDTLMAIEHMETAARLEPKHAPHHMALGKLFLEMGERGKAMNSLEHATRLAPEMAEAWLALAAVQQATGDLEQAAFSAERAIEHSPEEIEPMLLRGEIAMQASNPRAAQSRAQSILHIQPEHPEALYLLARALDGLNRPSEALSALEKAIPLAKNPLPMQLEQARLVRSSLGPQAGLDALRSLSQQYPEDASVLACLAGSLLEAGQIDTAIQAAKLALHVDTGQLTMEGRAALHFQIGRQLRGAGQLDQAIHNLSEAISEAPDEVEAYLELGKAMQDRRQHAQALSVYQQAMQISRNDFRPYYQAGLACKESKDYQGAEEMLRRAAELAPNDVSIHRMLGAVVALNLVHNRRH